MFHQSDLFEPVHSIQDAGANHFDLAALIELITDVSARPRYTFMVLSLIAKAAGDRSCSAGPYVQERGTRVLLRDWLCDALMPVAKRDARRRAIVDDVTKSLVARGALPSEPHLARSLIDQEVRKRVRHSGRCNVSRAVSDLVRAGLVRRHYQGYSVDHQNRGAQREAVYTITDMAAEALKGSR